MENFKISSEFTAKFLILEEKTNNLIFFHAYCYLGKTHLFPFSIIPSQITILKHAVNMGQKARPL